MIRTIFALLFCSGLFVSCENNSAKNIEDKGKEKIEKSCDTLMQTFAEGQFKRAIQSLKQFSVVDNASIDTLTMTAFTQMTNNMNGYGNIISYELVGDKSVNDFLIQRTYILRFDNGCMKFVFTLYKGKTGWTVTGFNYDIDISDLFK